MIILGKTTSINVRKVLWTCTEIGLSYDQQDYGSGFQPVDTADFRALNPNALVPVLVDGDFVLWESNTICRYLAASAERFDLLPQSAKARAMVEKWMDWQATELNNAWRYAFMALVRQSPAHRDADAIAASIREWNRHLVMVDEQLQRTCAWMAGEDFTLADIVIGLSINRWYMTPMEKPELAAVADYHQQLLAREGFRLFGANGVS